MYRMYSITIALLLVNKLAGSIQKAAMFRQEHLLIFCSRIQLEIYMNASISPADALIEGFVYSHALRQLQLHLFNQWLGNPFLGSTNSDAIHLKRVSLTIRKELEEFEYIPSSRSWAPAAADSPSYHPRIGIRRTQQCSGSSDRHHPKS